MSIFTSSNREPETEFLSFCDATCRVKLLQIRSCRFYHIVNIPSGERNMCLAGIGNLLGAGIRLKVSTRGTIGETELHISLVYWHG